MNNEDRLEKLAASLKSDGKTKAAQAIIKAKEEYGLRKTLAVMKASPKEVSVPVESMQDLFAVLRANIVYLQYAHWVTKDDEYYGDHLLYERLYNESNEEIDGFAEKVVPIAGEESVNPIITTKKVLDVLEKYTEADNNADNNTLAALALNMERKVLESLEAAHESLEGSGGLTMGFEDMLQAMHNSHESHTYLLGQRVGGE